LVLLGSMLSIYSQKVVWATPKPSATIDSIFSIFNRTPQGNIDVEPRGIPSQINQDLYNSIYTGMSYEEVRAIIGWDGISIYENEIDGVNGKIREKTYQWSSEDVEATNYGSPTYDKPLEIDEQNLYWSVTLHFQNDVLINKTSVNLEP
jgi:hypothetical protein